MEKQKVPFITPELTVEELTQALYDTSLRLQHTNQELLQSQKEQQEIFTNVSHDLRSPITAIRNSVEYLLSSEKLDEVETNNILQIVLRRIDFLEQLINDVFLLTSIDSTQKTFSFEPINIGMLLEDFFFTCCEDRNYSACKLDLNVPAHFPYQVLADGKMLVRVLDNLFTNALKYSDGDLTITLSACTIDNTTIKITVSDTGMGIAKDHIEKIFNRTYMVANSRTPSTATGCGLGLSIAKSIIEKHNGQIWCESDLGKGSEFSFSLPIIENN
ncbi:sensor histidine kinase [Anaerosporobacter sp.]